MKSSSKNNYVLLSKQNLKPREPILYLEPNELIIEEIKDKIRNDKVIAIDFETKSTDSWNPESYVVGIGIASSSYCCYVNLCVGSNPLLAVDLLNWLAKRKLTAFNVAFDKSYFVRIGLNPEFVMCTFGMFRYLATEGWYKQRFNLDVLIQDILGWPVSNKQTFKQHLNERGLTKAEMYKADPEMLGHYCALDAEAAYQAFRYFAGVVKKLPNSKMFTDFHKNEFLTSVDLLIEQNLRGMEIDVKALKLYMESVDKKLQQALSSIHTHKDVAPWLTARRLAVLKVKSKEPKKHRKDGVVTVGWTKWYEKKDIVTDKEVFNMNSKPQLGELFFDHLGFESSEETSSGERKVDKDVLKQLGEVGELVLAYNKIKKEYGYITALYNKTLEGDGIFHPNYKSVGAVTGRLGGGKSDDE